MVRDRYLKQSLGTLHTLIRESKILVVGAGGIGCELLKNLVCTGYGNIHIVDLDTIDLSNLNRQFLFRQSHIKKSKALVAKDAAGAFNPNVNIEAYHANIKDAKFNVDWFKSFVIVFNALDNLDARRHVNKMCLAADVPLIESGTTGFNGQVQPIRKGVTHCYECTQKETPKSFPVCTIRSTPSQPIHCIVWAKSYLFNELFGVSEDAAPDVDHTEDADNRQEIDNLRREAAALNRIRDSMGTDQFPKKVFEKVFKEDIDRLRSMDEMWKTRRPPEPLDYDEEFKQTSSVPATIHLQDQKVWNVAENLAVFSSSLMRLSARLAEMKPAASAGGPGPALTFDKDDKDTLDFVASAANLRSVVFGIDAKSEFDIKQMAGNIIPAIATTNATTAALCVLQAFKVMQGQMDKAKMVFLAKSVDRVIDREDLSAPNPDCAVCNNVQARLRADVNRCTLSQLVASLRTELGYTDEISIATDAGLIYDPDFEENLPKTLAAVGVNADSFLTIMDLEDEPTKVDLVLSVSSLRPDEGSPLDFVPPDVKIPNKQVKAPVDEPAPDSAGDLKRKRQADEASAGEEASHKRGKPTPKGDADNVILLDGGDGAIVLD